MYPQEQEEMDFNPVSPYEAAEYEAKASGADEPDREWLITPFDTWVRNPFYTGQPGRHPEMYDYSEDDLPVAFIPSEFYETGNSHPEAETEDDDLPF